MFKIEELDDFVSAEAQLQDDRPESVVLINIFHMTPGDVDTFIMAWANVIRRFESQRGFISAQLYRGTAGSGTVINNAVWESTAHYRTAFENPEFRQRLPAYPESVVAMPHLFQKVAVPDVCVA